MKSAFLLLASLFAVAPVCAETRRIENFQLNDFRGKTTSLVDFKESKLVVVAFVGVECPLVKLYAERLATLNKKYAKHGVTFIGVNSNQQDSLAELAHFARVNGIEFPLLKDPANRVADEFQAERTPEVFVLDASRNVRYQGRIDDQFTYGIQRPQVEKEYLVQAIDELLAGKEVSTPKTEVVGCHIGRVLKPQENAEVTWSNQISRILQKRCVECHREGEIGPFSLTDYKEVVGWAEMIDEVVREQRMPPWHASPEHGEFLNDTRLTDIEKQQIYEWVAAGAPFGDESELPKPREFEPGWRIGKPDKIIAMANRPFSVPAAGEVKYQYFRVDPGFTEDKWVKAAECRPGNREVVHHIIVAVIPPSGVRSKHAGIGSEWLTATAPGAQPLVLRPGMAKFIPKGSKLLFQMHYTPNGEPQKDLSSVGLQFADPEEVRHLVATKQASNHRFRIPPGEDNHKVEATFRFAEESLLLTLFPHMHLRGKSFKYTAVYPDGEQEVLLDVPRYDFNWQNGYMLKEPKLMPAGTRIHCVAHFDNSAENLANPDPTETVRWGDQTWEEMMIGYFDMTPTREIRPGAETKSRTQSFLEDAKRSPPVMSEELKTSAKGAVHASTDFSRFSASLAKLVPQLDRVDWVTVEDEKLNVNVAAQMPNFRRLVGGKGISTRAQGTALSSLAGQHQPAAIDDLNSHKESDLVFMKRAFQSSFHVPLKIDGKPGSINFWSAEKAAFPPAAQPILVEAAKSLAK